MMNECPDIETLAAFAEGKLKRNELPRIAEHMQDCIRCMAAVEAVVESAPAESQSETSSRGWWLAIAAAVVIAVLGITWLRPRAPLSRLVALAPTDARIVEPRLSGGFGWAPYRGNLRASGNETTGSERLKLGGAAAELIDRADRDHHAAGVAMLLVDRPEQAIEQLRIAAEHAPDDAKSWSDLAAARYAAALDLGRPSLYPEALAAADRALRIDPKLAEAQFNRALILDRLGLTKEARAAWQRYLEIDPSSQWAAEARQHLKHVAQTLLSVPRALAEVEYLGKWGAEGNSRSLNDARAIGEQVARSTGESMLRDAVRAIDTNPNILAEAHALYRRGRIEYSRQNLADAERDLRLAETKFAAGQSPMALMARYYVAAVRYDRSDIAGATAELEALLAAEQPRYIALAAQVRWELALCRSMDDDWLGAETLLVKAESQFAALNEPTNVAAVQSILASVLVSLGRADAAWAARIRSFQILSAMGDDARLAPFVAGAARMELRAGNLEAAAPLMQLEESLVHGNDVLLANTLTREAVLQHATGDARAAQTAAKAALVAKRIQQPELRARAEADARFAEGAAATGRDAVRLLSAAIDSYRQKKMTAFLPETLLLRARASLALGEKAAAADDLEQGIALFEKQRVDVGTGVLDAGTSLFDEAIRLALDRGDREKAFAYAERSKCGAGSPTRPGGSEDPPHISIIELQKRLKGTNAALLELHLLGDELAAFCITANSMSVSRTRATGDEYERFIRPSEIAMQGAKELIVVPDPRLENVAYAALYDSAKRQYLIERMTVATAVSAASLSGLLIRHPELVEGPGREEGAEKDHERATPPPRSLDKLGMTALIAVALPSGEAHALPETTAEVGEINRLYSNAIAKEPASFATFADAARDARIIHIAGHTERQRGAGDVALLFGGGERVSWRTIAGRHFDGAPIVVLAACETLRSPRAPGIRTRSLGEGFLAAGAGAVIGTLAPIADRDAAELFRAVHRRLAKGAGAEEALRGAQLELLHSSPAWKSLAVLIRRLPDEKEKTWATSRFTSTASARSSANRSLPSSE
jgi:hypothetical protein